MKRLLLIIGTAAFLAQVCIQLYSRYFNPDVAFFLKVAKASDQWAEQIGFRDKPVYILAGGSEARSGIDPEIMLNEFGIPMINAAEGAGYGVMANTTMACRYLKQGDTLILSLLSTNPGNYPPTADGLKLAAFCMGSKTFSTPFIQFSPQNLKKILIGNATSMFVAATRALIPGKPLYKYNARTVIHPSGWMEIQYRDMVRYIPHKFDRPNQLNDFQKEQSITQFLSTLSEYTRMKGVNLVISLPWACRDEMAREQSALTALRLTEMGMKVLKDPHLGCQPDSALYADMAVHLNATGSRMATGSMAKALQTESYWTEQELEEILKEYHRDKTGNYSHSPNSLPQP